MTDDREVPAEAGDLLSEAREGLGRRAWDEAYRRFTAADARQKLGGADLEDLAEAARWSGRFVEVVDLLERAEAAHLAAGDAVAATPSRRHASRCRAPSSTTCAAT